MRSLQERLTTEDRIEARLQAGIKRLRGWCVKLPGVSMVGWPDRMCLLPGGRVVFAELKRPVGGVFERLQPLIHRKLRKLGFTVAVLRTREQVDQFLEGL